jgi:MerR family transcriptional regulator, redox-sensitive transcriptional activator SoxR
MPDSTTKREFTVGELATRSGITTSALRFYEEHGLIVSTRNISGHRRYSPDALRRVSFIKVAQRVGLTLHEIGQALASLPDKRTPTASDWARLAEQWRPLLDGRIATLKQLRDQLDSCIGCGCLSLQACHLYNPEDIAASLGEGPRFLLGDKSSDVVKGSKRTKQ